MNKFYILLSLTFCVLLILLLMVSYQSLKVQEQNQQLLSKLVNRPLSSVQQTSSKTGRSPDDSYLKKQVKNTIIKNASEIQKCYNQMLAANPDQDKGKVVIDWQIDDQGKVIEVGMIRNPFHTDGVPISSFGDCIKDTIGAIQFPKPPFGLVKYVEHSFLFKKEDRSD